MKKSWSSVYGPDEVSPGLSLRLDLGLTPAAHRVEGGRGHGGQTRAHPRRSDHQLSETERLIVELVVAGRRNGEIAAELNLSPNTVSWNLSKIYRKLGIRSRAELAAKLAAEQTPAVPPVPE